MRSFCLQKKFQFYTCCCYISIFQLRTITGFIGKAGFTCLDKGKQDLGNGCLNYRSLCKSRADYPLNESGYPQLFVQAFSRFLTGEVKPL